MFVLADIIVSSRIPEPWFQTWFNLTPFKLSYNLHIIYKKLTSDCRRSSNPHSVIECAKVNNSRKRKKDNNSRKEKKTKANIHAVEVSYPCMSITSMFLSVSSIMPIILKSFFFSFFSFFPTIKKNYSLAFSNFKFMMLFVCAIWYYVLFTYFVCMFCF
jgi:hypothetical protein